MPWKQWATPTNAATL